MKAPLTRSLFGLLLAFALGVVVASLGSARAQARPAIDRELVERLVRAEEAQTRELEALVRATDKCHH
jgi:hypothetical protein